MAKLFEFSINLSKVNKDHIRVDKNGNKWLNGLMWLNDQPDQYGNMFSLQQKTKGGEKCYIGNGKEYQKKDNNNDDLL